VIVYARSGRPEVIPEKVHGRRNAGGLWGKFLHPPVDLLGQIGDNIPIVRPEGRRGELWEKFLPGPVDFLGRSWYNVYGAP